jgi:hypothetical protein
MSGVFYSQVELSGKLNSSVLVERIGSSLVYLQVSLCGKVERSSLAFY